MNFYAPMDVVWKSVKEPENIIGDDSFLRMIGLPIPNKCSMSEDGKRICYFEEGEMHQVITNEDIGKSFSVDIVECTFVIREWLSFINASYNFIQRDGFVEVIRTDNIQSTLRPRWYWYWFESKCVQLEHRFVMSSMKQKAESISP